MARKKMVRRRAKKVRRVRREVKKAGYNKTKFALVIKNLVLFVLLALISLALTYLLANQNSFLETLFLVLAMVFGFVAVAFLITLLILLILKVSKK